MRPYPKKITILVDSREKCPLLFPKNLVLYDDKRRPHLIRIDTRVETLLAGDYQLDGDTSACIVERKGSPQEVFTNLCTHDRRRAVSALVRLAHACHHPVLLLDFNMADFFPGNESNPDFSLALSELLRLVWKYRIHVITGGRSRAAGPRRKLGEFIAKLLISAAYDDLQEDARVGPQPR